MDEASSELISRNSSSISLNLAVEASIASGAGAGAERYGVGCDLGDRGDAAGEASLSEMLVEDEAGPGPGDVLFHPKKEVSFVPGDRGLEVELESKDSSDRFDIFRVVPSTLTSRLAGFKF